MCDLKMFRFMGKWCYYVLSGLLATVGVTISIRFSAESFSEISMLAKEGKQHLDSINEKSNVPQYGPCWKNAVADLQIGCKFLSENIQSDLALRFTDCFLQMSGHEPIICKSSRDSCLKQLSDRAFNAYTEFYTHTQSICYFLQSQLWHEEAERTIDRLSSTSMQVSVQLEEAEKTQAKLLVQQKESLSLQHNLIDNGKNIAFVLEQSGDKISTIMKEFHTSTAEQKKALFELFEKLSSLRSWAVGEVSWLNSMLFYTSAVILAYLFTSASRTLEARIYIYMLLSVNYFLERLIYSTMLDEAREGYKSLSSLTEDVNSWIWLCRKTIVAVCILVTIFVASRYCDYNIVNYQLLLEIKNQNEKILNYFTSNVKINKSENIHTCISTTTAVSCENEKIVEQCNVIPLPYHALFNDSLKESTHDRVPVNFSQSNNLTPTCSIRNCPDVSSKQRVVLLKTRKSRSPEFNKLKIHANIDRYVMNEDVSSSQLDNLSVISEKSNNSLTSEDLKLTCNLRRSSRVVKKVDR